MPADSPLKPVPYAGVKLTPEPTPHELRAARSDYEAMLVSVLRLVLDRFDRTPGYPWIDTKLNIVTGEDFPPDDPARGYGAVYGWIQGRALEALAGHAHWLHRSGRHDLDGRIRSVMESVLGALRSARERNAGHAFFLMTPDGSPRIISGDGRVLPVALDESAPWNFSDLFCAKGMYAAAHYLGDTDALTDARDYCASVAESLFARGFASDQQALDPKNPVTAPAGMNSHGPFMIAIGMARLLVELDDDREGVDLGISLIDYVMERHVVTAPGSHGLRENDFVEFVDDDGEPYVSDGRILSDPGHALEFAGLTLRFISAARRSSPASGPRAAKLDTVARAMPGLLRRVFGYGFRENPGGICKLYDLRARQAVNTDMPWWSLPETMRAALACCEVAADDVERAECLRVYAACHNAFVANFVRADRHLMAVQTVDEHGCAVDVIPATPDADPGYHTGLSLIDCMEMLDARIQGS